MDFSIEKMTVCVPLTSGQWDKLETIDYDYLSKELDNLGGHEVDYNGHFGSNIYFQCSDHNQATQIAEKIGLLLK